MKSKLLVAFSLLVLIGCGRSPQVNTTNYSCPNDEQPVQTMAGAWVCPSTGNAPVVIVQPSHDSFIENMLLYHMLLGNHDSGTTVNHYNYYHHHYDTAPNSNTGQASAPKNAVAAPSISSRPSSNFKSFGSTASTSPSKSSSFGSFNSDSGSAYKPSTRSYGSTSTGSGSSFGSFGRSSSSRPSSGSSFHSFGRRR